MRDNFIFYKKGFYLQFLKLKLFQIIIVVKFTNKMRFCLTKKKLEGGQVGGLKGI